MFTLHHHHKKTSYRFRLNQWTTCLLFCGTAAIQLLNFGQLQAQEETDKLGEACFDQFDPTGGDKAANSYLMLTSSFFIYPAEVGIEELSVETEAFQEPFEERMEHFGMNQFFYFHEESPFEMEEFMGATDEIHHTDCVVMANEEAIVVVCRGSLPIGINPSNWITNFSFGSENVSHHFESDLFPDEEIWCHTGFWTAADSVFIRIRNCVSFLKVQSDRPVYLTGHSLGGALATILSMRLYADGAPPEEIFTFAAPRVGDSGFAELFAFSGVNHHRWMNPGDPGPMLPPEAFGFRHTSSPYLTTRAFSDPITAHSCQEYAKGIWPNLSVETRESVPRWFESDWAWVTPEDNNEAGTPDESSSENLSDPRQVDFTHNEYDPYYYFDTDNRELLEKQNMDKQPLDVIDALIYSTITSPEELDRETEKLLYRYKDEPSTDQLKSLSDSK